MNTPHPAIYFYLLVLIDFSFPLLTFSFALSLMLDSLSDQQGFGVSLSLLLPFSTLFIPSSCVMKVKLHFTKTCTLISSDP